jgi:hypothetical protein
MGQALFEKSTGGTCKVCSFSLVSYFSRFDHSPGIVREARGP